jgi:hypothetical protein
MEGNGHFYATAALPPGPIGVGPGVGLGPMEKRKIFPPPGTEHRLSSPFPFAIPTELSRVIYFYMFLVSLLILFWKSKSTLMSSPSCVCVCVCVSVSAPYQSLNGRSNLCETWYVYHGIWAHLNRLLHKSLQSVFAFVRVSLLSLLGDGSVNTFPRRVHATIEELLDASFSMSSIFYQRRVCGTLCVSPYRC